MYSRSIQAQEQVRQTQATSTAPAEEKKTETTGRLSQDRHHDPQFLRTAEDGAGAGACVGDPPPSPPRDQLWVGSTAGSAGGLASGTYQRNANSGALCNTEPNKGLG